MNEQKMIDLVNRIADNDKVAPFQNGFVVLTNEEMVRFAELIVKECAGILDKMSGLPDDTGGNAYLAAGSKKIRQHFGVDE